MKNCYKVNMTQPAAEIENFDIETELQYRCKCKSYNYGNEFLIRLQAYRYIDISSKKSYLHCSDCVLSVRQVKEE